jgi:hypothetical protein
MSDNRKIVPLAKTKQEMLAHRKYSMNYTLNDRIEAIHLMLMPDEDAAAPDPDDEKAVQMADYQEQYYLYLDAVYDEQSIEGKIAADNQEAARIIRLVAKDPMLGNDAYVGSQKLITIVRSMGVVLRRYNMSRTDRAHSVDGEIVPNGQ